MPDLASEPIGSPGLPNWTAFETLRRGWAATPELRVGARFTILLAFLGTAGRLVLPVLLQLAIDRGLRSGDVRIDYVVRLAIVGVAIVVISQLAAFYASMRLGRSGEAALLSLRRRVFAHTHALSVTQQNDFRRGVLVTRVTSDLEMLSQFFVWGGLTWLLDTSLMLVTAVAMALYDPLLAAIVVVVSAPLLVLLRQLQQRLVTVYGQSRERNAEFLTDVADMVAGAPVIRVYGAGRRRAEAATARAERLRRANVRAGSLSALLFPTGEMFSCLAIAAVVLVGIIRGPSSHLTSGAIVGFVFLAYRFLEPIGELTEVLDQTQTAMTGWRRSLGMLEITPDIPQPEQGLTVPYEPPALELRHVTLQYHPRPGEPDTANPPALVDVSLQIGPGSHVAVVGATGSGKSTLARLMARLVDPSQGQVLIQGLDLRDVDDVSFRRSLVLVPQEPFLFTTTIGENVLVGRPDADLGEVGEAFASLGLDAWLATLPDGLDTVVGERGEQLSAGERQLVALVRAAIARPMCLLLDEATSSVDPATDAMLARALTRLASGRTSVVIAHRLSTAARADRILVFDQGRMVEDGTHDDLLAANGTYASLFASWLQSTDARDAGT